MERLSHDLNLALEESNCGRQERRKFGLRRRTRSAGNLPAAVAVSLVEDGSSSSPPQAPLITQPLSDSDDPHLNAHKSSSLKSRHYCQIGNFESDSFNENFSPTRQANVRRKRKFKKIPVEYMDGKHSPPIEILTVTTEANTSPSTITLQAQGYSTLVNINKDKTALLRQERSTNAFCGKRKWSHRDKDVCEMRERSFSGGCSSKSAFFGKSDFKPKKYELDKKKKDMVIQPGKIVLKSQNLESIKPAVMNTPSLPGSSSFNFVYKNSSKNATPVLSNMMGYRVTTDLPPFLNPTTSSGKNSDYKYHRKLKLLNKTHAPKSLRNPLQFDDSNSGMECTGNDESSSLSSSDSDGLVTNDSDREGDDELTDWPGIEELKVFNKSLSFKSSKTINNNSQQSVSNMPPPKRLKKEKFLAKSGIASCKNKFKKKRAKVESGNEDDAMMSDSKTVVDVEEDFLTRERKDILQPHSSFTSFSDVKNAGGAGHNADESFFHSFQAFQERTQKEEIFEPRTNFTLQKTSSSDLNLSERSAQSEVASAPYEAGLACDSREILAGCRRVRCSRRGLRIVSSAAEPLARFLQDSCRAELLLPPPADDQETDSLGKLADLYSLDLQVVMGRPVLRKTSNTMQAVEVEHSCSNLPTEHKRRCYGEGDDTTFDQPLPLPLPLPIFAESPAVGDGAGDLVFSKKNGLFAEKKSSGREYDTFSESLIDKSLLDPGKLD